MTTLRASLLLAMLLTGCAHHGAPGTANAIATRPMAVHAKSQGRVLGIGGIFFKSANDQAQRDWYGRHLGLTTTAEQGTSFSWELPGQPQTLFSTRWYVFQTSTGYFNGPCMVDYIVDDLDALVQRLNDEGVQVAAPMDTDEGKFAWAVDADGDRLELWQPRTGAPVVAHDHVQGIGGVFFKSANQKAQYDWYARHLGITADPDWGANFLWEQPGNPPIARSTTWTVFPAATTYFNGPCMVNYILDDLDATLQRLKDEGVQVDPHTESSYGSKFGWAFDADGNRIELWEPAKPPAPGSRAHGQPVHPRPARAAR